ncbi:hypothetical protein HNQ88_001826 [Aureibacter tunicatorum]|uniref:Uncharacterized protein n=1 Tax=Aureibacter tunicatorum TaxID=866807 RepID=A0AAE3XPB0_9BACT|nr:hypothetical protein [Aureibacter tunicatorum]BDD05281.1 hypothetical protein AUTU_27640 [Aureibacter tunicatorum]
MGYELSENETLTVSTPNLELLKPNKDAVPFTFYEK